MPFRYQPFKIVTKETSEKDMWDFTEYNRNILADGVRGMACLDYRPVTRGERIDYEQFAPYNSILSKVEVYENGAMNIYVRNKSDFTQIGVITVRPLTD